MDSPLRDMTDEFLKNLREVIKFAKIKNMEISCLFTPDMNDDEQIPLSEEKQIFGVRCYNSRIFEHKK